MGRSRCLALASLLLLVPSLLFVSPAAATALHPDVVAFGGRRSLLQAPRSSANPPVTLPTPPVEPPANPPVTAPTPPVEPPATPPTPPVEPPATPPTRVVAPVSPPTSAARPPTPAGGATPPTTASTPTGRSPTRAPTPTPVAVPAPVPIFAPAPAPIGVTSSQRRNAIIAGGVVGAVVLVALVLIFCRCRFMKRSKRLPFQRLQMT